jgi:hypothetical protein
MHQNEATRNNIEVKLIGRIGGQLMSLDRELPAWVVGLPGTTTL